MLSVSGDDRRKMRAGDERHQPRVGCGREKERPLLFLYHTPLVAHPLFRSSPFWPRAWYKLTVALFSATGKCLVSHTLHYVSLSLLWYTETTQPKSWIFSLLRPPTSLSFLLKHARNCTVKAYSPVQVNSLESELVTSGIRKYRTPNTRMCSMIRDSSNFDVNPNHNSAIQHPPRHIPVTQKVTDRDRLYHMD